MSVVDFAKLADLDVGDIEEPKPLPVGSYFAEIVGEPSFTSSKEKGTPGIAFTFALKEAGDDVDEEELQVHGSLVNSAGQPRQLKKTYWYIATTSNFGWDFRQLCDSFGFEGKISDILPKLAGAEVQLLVKHKQSNRGRPMVEIDSVSAREE